MSTAWPAIRLALRVGDVSSDRSRDMNWEAYRSKPSCAYHSNFKFMQTVLDLERFFIHHVRHLLDISTVVFLQHIDQALHTASGHAFVRIRRQPCNLRGAGKMRK